LALPSSPLPLASPSTTPPGDQCITPLQRVKTTKTTTCLTRPLARAQDAVRLVLGRDVFLVES